MFKFINDEPDPEHHIMIVLEEHTTQSLLTLTLVLGIVDHPFAMKL